MEAIEYSKIDIQGYYTPEPSEFHVGFEYEKIESIVYKDNRWGFPVKSQVFTKKHWTSTGANYNFFEDLKEGRIRVKKLTKDDIESLGFSLDQRVKGEYFFIIGNMIEGDHMLSTSDFINISIYPLIGTRNTSKFEGKVKNKSELIKILKQIGYESKN